MCGLAENIARAFGRRMHSRQPEYGKQTKAKSFFECKVFEFVTNLLRLSCLFGFGRRDSYWAAGAFFSCAAAAPTEARARCSSEALINLVAVSLTFGAIIARASI